MSNELAKLPDEQKQSALLRVLKATTTLPAKLTFYASALGAGAILLSSGHFNPDVLPPALVAFVTSVGVNTLSDILAKVARGDADEQNIARVVKKAVEQSDIENRLADQSFQRDLAKVLRQQRHIFYAIDQNAENIAVILLEHYAQYSVIQQETLAELSALGSKSDAILQAVQSILQILSASNQQLVGQLLQTQSTDIRGHVDKFLQSYLTNFGGRETELNELDQWLTQSEKRLAMLISPAGRGKSALAANWVAKLRQRGLAHVVYHPISLRYGTHKQADILRNLLVQLKRVQNTAEDNFNYFNKDAKSLESELILELQSFPKLDLPVIMVIDGLDEMDIAPQRDISLPSKLGEGIYIFVTMRGDPQADRLDWLKRLDWNPTTTTFFELAPLSFSGVTEVILQTGLNIEPEALETLTRQIHRLSEGGDPLVVKLWVDEIANHFERVRTTQITQRQLRGLNLESYTPGVEGYLRETAKQLSQTGVEFDSFFKALCFARGPLTQSDLEALQVDTKLTLFGDINRKSRGLIIEVDDSNSQETSYTFSHPMIGFAYQKLYLSDISSIREWVKRFQDYGSHVFNQLMKSAISFDRVPNYILNCYSIHLIDDRIPVLPEEVFKLVNPLWMKAHFERTGAYDTFLADVGRAWELADRLGQERIKSGQRVATFDIQIKCMICFSTVASLASQLPPLLPALLLRDGLWQKYQARSYANRVPDPLQRAQTRLALLQIELDDLAKAFTSSEQQTLASDILDDIQLLEEKESSEIRSKLIIELLPFLTDVYQLQKAVRLAEGLVKDIWRTRTLAHLISRIEDQSRQIAILKNIIYGSSVFTYGDYHEDADYAPYIFEVVAQNIPIHLLQTAWSEIQSERYEAIKEIEPIYKEQSSTRARFEIDEEIRDKYEKHQRETERLNNFFEYLAWHIPSEKAEAFLAALWEKDNLHGIGEKIARFAFRLPDAIALNIANEFHGKVINLSQDDRIGSRSRFAAGCGLAYIALAYGRKDQQFKQHILEMAETYIENYAHKDTPLTKQDLQILYGMVTSQYTDAQLASLVTKHEFLSAFSKYHGESRKILHYQELIQYLGIETTKALFHDRKDTPIGGLPYLLPGIAEKLDSDDLEFVFEIGYGRGEFANLGYIRAIAQLARDGKISGMPQEWVDQMIVWALHIYTINDARQELLQAVTKYVSLETIREHAQYYNSSLAVMSPYLSIAALQEAYSKVAARSDSLDYILPVLKYLPPHERIPILKEYLAETSWLVDSGQLAELSKTFAKTVPTARKLKLQQLTRRLKNKALDTDLRVQIQNYGPAWFLPEYFNIGRISLWPGNLVKILNRQLRVLFFVEEVTKAYQDYKRRLTHDVEEPEMDHDEDHRTAGMRLYTTLAYLMASSQLFWRISSILTFVVILIILPFSILALLILIIIELLKIFVVSPLYRVVKSFKERS